MHVGILKFYIRLDGNSSLKGKRQAIRPIIAQLRNRFNVSVAEVADQDQWQSAVIGVSLVSGDRRVADEMLSSVRSFVNSGRFSVEIIKEQVEIIPV